MIGRTLALVVIMMLAAAAVWQAGVASAARPDNPNCWGVVTSQRATSAHDIGEHSSAQDEPRLGLGNVARVVIGEGAHLSDLGSALAELDELSATGCP